MKKKIITAAGILFLASLLLFGCSDKSNAGKDTSRGQTESASLEEEKQSDANASSDPETEKTSGEHASSDLKDGTYSAEFDTDNTMFRVNEACDGKGTLTVKNGEMTIHVSLVSKNIVNLYPGVSEDARKDGAELLEPTTDTVTYSDGISEEVYGFDIPVPVLDEEFDMALIGTKGVWYDHKVIVSDPKPLENE